MTDRAAGFLQRRILREQSRALTQHLVLGSVLSLLMIVFGGYQYLAVMGAWDPFWRLVAMGGVLAALLTFFVPSVWQWPEMALRKIGNLVGSAVIVSVLTLIYYLIIWPTGALLRRVRGTQPIYSWSQAVPAHAEGWTTKQMPPDLPGQDQGEATRRRSGMWQVLVFFVRRGNIIFIPVLLILVSLGIALFFLQTSALAPLIYTLF